MSIISTSAFTPAQSLNLAFGANKLNFKGQKGVEKQNNKTLENTAKPGQILLKASYFGLNFTGKNPKEAKKEASETFCILDRGRLIPVEPYSLPGDKGRAAGILDVLRYENPQKKYFIRGKERISEEIRQNSEAQEFVKLLDELTQEEQKEFIELFCKETGFPDLDAVCQKMEAEITGAIHKLADENDFDVKFIGYDKNCSMGRGVAFPGRDADALFMIIDTKEHEEPWFAGAMRWDFKDLVNQRILCTPAGGLPEVLSTDFIEEGLELADTAFKKAGFTNADLERFLANLSDNSKDFVKAAEFDIRLAEKLPADTETRDKFYKTAMLVELLRSGKIVENNFDTEFLNKLKKSPLYKYSNIIRQEGFSASPKEKHTKRVQTAKDFHAMDTAGQFALIRDMIHSSLYIKDAENEGLFVNVNSNGEDEMGNILEMYDMLMHKEG